MKRYNRASMFNRMRPITILLLITLVVGACKKIDLSIVESFVQEVKADHYFHEELPDFNIGHIDALFNYAGDEQLVNRFPWPSYSSYYPGQKEVGLVMLYAIEVIRREGRGQMTGVYIYDPDHLERKVTLNEVLPLYQEWWAKNKGKSAGALRKINPLEGTGLTWLESAAPE